MRTLSKLILTLLLIGTLSPVGMLSAQGDLPPGTVPLPGGGVDVPQSPIPNISVPATTVVLVTLDNLNVRSLPRINAPSLQVAPRGTTILALGRSSDLAWVQVQYKGVVGWVSAVYLGPREEILRLAITDGTPGAAARPQERVAAPDGTLVQTGQLIVFGANNAVNVRQLPDEGAELLGRLAQNQRVTVTQLDPTRQWGQITFNGQQGWVALYVVTVLGDIRTVAVLGQPGTGSQLPVAASGGIPVNTLEQRAALDRAQAHLARYLSAASTMQDTFGGAVANGFIACNTQFVPFFRAYRPNGRDFVLVPELESITNDMNAAFEQLNRARTPWVGACEARSTQATRGLWPSWLEAVRGALPLLQDAQRRLAFLTAR